MGCQTNDMNGINGHGSEHGTQSILQILDGINAQTFNNEGERAQAVLVAYALVSRLETPWEFVARLCMGQVCGSPTLLHLKQRDAENQRASIRSCSKSSKESTAI